MTASSHREKSLLNNTHRSSNGCVMVIIILALLFFIQPWSLPVFNYRALRKAKECEVKQNLHAIQLALERYSVDHPDYEYPLRLMGGDWTDTQVVWESWVIGNTMSGDIQEMLDNIQVEEKRLVWEPAAQDMGDALVMESYMPSFPGNPFVKHQHENELLKIHHHPGSAYPGHAPWWRYVGGRESNKMYEVFGPAFTGGPEYCSNAGDIYVHHIFNSPAYDYQFDELKTPRNGWVDPSGNQWLAGNFSYYPRLEPGLSLYHNADPQVIGYTLAGYGSIKTPGMDVYNRNGNYDGRYRTDGYPVDDADGEGPIPFPTDIPCLHGQYTTPGAECNDGGPDTIPDGVIMILESGVGRKKPVLGADVQESI